MLPVMMSEVELLTIVSDVELDTIALAGTDGAVAASPPVPLRIKDLKTAISLLMVYIPVIPYLSLL